MITTEGMQILANGALIALLCGVLNYATQKPNTRKQGAIETDDCGEEVDN